MDIEECRMRLLDKVWRFHPLNAEGIVDYMIANTPLENIRSYLLTAPDYVLLNLFEGANRLQKILNWSEEKEQPLYGPFIPIEQIGPQKQHQFPSRSYSQAPLHPIGPTRAFQNPFLPIDQIGPQKQRQFPSISYSQAPLHPIGPTRAFQNPFLPIDQIGPQKQHQFLSRSYSQAPLHPIGPTRAFQNPYSKLTDFGDHFQSLSILDHAMPSHYKCGSINVHGYPGNDKVQTKTCWFYLSFGNCKYGENCRFSHVSGYPEINDMRQVHHLGSLEILEMEIRDLLLLQPSSQVPVEHLEKMYLEAYTKPLEIDGFYTEGQRNMKAGCGLTDLLMQLNTTRVIERQGRYYVVLAKDSPKYFTHGFQSATPPAGSDFNKICITFKSESIISHTNVQNYFRQGRHNVFPVEDVPKYLTGGFESEMPAASNDSNKIFISFNCKSIFTHADVQNYFSQYGTVSGVRFSNQKKREFGFVTFLDSRSAKHIISERGLHFICGNEVHVKAYREKHELEMLAKKDAHSSCGVRDVSDVDEVGEHHTGDKEVELSHVPSHLDGTSDKEAFLIANLESDNTTESLGVPNRRQQKLKIVMIDDLGLPDDLGV